MRRRWHLAIAGVLSAGLAAAAACSGTILIAVNTLPHGTWGGDHAALVVTDGASTLQLDCAHGTLDSPVRIDHDGQFNVTGDFVREHGGPVTSGAPEDRHAARFVGSVDNGRLTLFITVGDLALHMGPFVLVLGGPPHLVRCL